MLTDKQEETEFDLIIIGGGPAGYICAIKAAQLKVGKIAVIEKRNNLGGTCLNVGCIPSKALLHSTEIYKNAKEKFAALGVLFDNVHFDIDKIMQHKDGVIAENARGIDLLFAKNKITRLVGCAKILENHLVEVHDVNDGAGAAKVYKTQNIVIATGSVQTQLPQAVIDEEYIISSDTALSLKSVPKNLAVIGGGYIGLEMASVWSRLGADVTVIEYADSIVPLIDKEVSTALQKFLEGQSVKFKLGTKLVSTNVNATSQTVQIVVEKNAESDTLEFDKVLVCVGRRPYTDGLFGQNINIKLDSFGRIVVNERFEACENVYAIGDVVAGPMLAHKAEEDGIAVAEILAHSGHGHGHVNYDRIPAVIYTSPEVAYIGKTEQELEKMGVKYKTGKALFASNGRSRAMLEVDGFVKVIVSDEPNEQDKILGVHIIGHDAGTMIGECVMAIEYVASAEDIARISHPHPTIIEVLKEACMAAAFGQKIHG